MKIDSVDMSIVKMQNLTLRITCIALIHLDVGVFGSIHRRLRGVGLSSIACGYMVRRCIISLTGPNTIQSKIMPSLTR